MKRIELLLDSNRGIYIPRDFTDMINWIYPADYKDTLSNPDNDNYWDTWNSTLDSAYYVDSEGYKWTLYQDGDLWAIRSDLFDDTESAEYKNMFFE